MDCFKLHRFELSGDELEIEEADSAPEDVLGDDPSNQPTSAR